MYGLGFLPLAPEHYDFLLVESRRERPAVQAFLAALRDRRTRERIKALGCSRPAADSADFAAVALSAVDHRAHQILLLQRAYQQHPEHVDDHQDYHQVRRIGVQASRPRRTPKKRAVT